MEEELNIDNYIRDKEPETLKKARKKLNGNCSEENTQEENEEGRRIRGKTK